MDEERIAALVAEQIHGLEQRMEGRFQSLEQRIEDRFQGLEGRFQGLEDRFQGLEGRFQGLEQRLEQRIVDSSANLAKLITDISDSLQKELRELHSHRSRMDARLSLHGGELQAGARWMSRVTNWMEATDDNMARRDERIADLEARVRKLEKDRPAA